MVCVCGACGVCVKGKGKENMHIHVCLVRGYTVHCMYVGGKGGARDSVCRHSGGGEVGCQIHKCMYPTHLYLCACTEELNK